MSGKSSYLVVLTFLLINSIAYGQMSYSNEDLQRYKEPPDSVQGEGQSQNKSESHDSGYSKDSDDKYMWCRRGEQARAAISTTNSNAAAAQEHYTSVHYRFMTRDTKPLVKIEEVDAARKQMDAAIDKVGRAKLALDQLETEARREGIPPGWLECNFN